MEQLFQVRAERELAPPDADPTWPELMGDCCLGSGREVDSARSLIHVRGDVRYKGTEP